MQAEVTGIRQTKGITLDTSTMSSKTQHSHSTIRVWHITSLTVDENVIFNSGVTQLIIKVNTCKQTQVDPYAFAKQPMKDIRKTKKRFSARKTILKKI